MDFFWQYDLITLFLQQTIFNFFSYEKVRFFNVLHSA